MSISIPFRKSNRCLLWDHRQHINRLCERNMELLSCKACGAQLHPKLNEYLTVLTIWNRLHHSYTRDLTHFLLPSNRNTQYYYYNTLTNWTHSRKIDIKVILACTVLLSRWNKFKESSYVLQRKIYDKTIQPSYSKPLGTLRPIYGTGVKLPSRCPILYLFNKYPYWIF